MKTDYPSPILKWAGGKNSLIRSGAFEAYIPEDFDIYYEPFFGAGALYFYLWKKGLIHKAVISDINSELCNVYSIIKSDYTSIIDYYTENINDFRNSQESFYNNRNRFNELRSIKIEQCTRDQKLERAVLMIYLNKTCYSGMYRENRNGLFNVPYGFYANPTIINPDNLEKVSDSLSDVKICNYDYKSTLKCAGFRDLVYLDPPYMPYKDVSQFVGYSSNRFSLSDQMELSQVFRKLDKRGCKLLMSNSSSPELNKLYSGPNITIKEVRAPRIISQRCGVRRTVTEYLITNQVILDES